MFNTNNVTGTSIRKTVVNLKYEFLIIVSVSGSYKLAKTFVADYYYARDTQIIFAQFSDILLALN